MRNPEQLKFTKSHEWLGEDGTVGITDHAQKEITDVVFVDLPKVGRDVKAGDPVAVVESVKAAFDIYAPVSGRIVTVNDVVAKDPAAVNKAPYGDGWLYRIERAADDGALFDYAAYQEFVKSAAH